MKPVFKGSILEWMVVFIGTTVLMPVMASAQTILFEEQFKDEITGDPQPVWSWDLRGDVREGMMVGPDDIYEVVEGEHYLSHRRALRMNFKGRNNLCNTCGGEYTEIDQLEDGKACMTVKPDTYEDRVYNLTNYFSVWEVSENSETRICVSNEQRIASSIYNEASSLSKGDAIYVPYECGVSGVIGKDVNRKSDCNKAVNYLDGIDSDQVGYGETVSRRFYIYIDEGAVLPNSTFKLGYSRWWHEEGKAYNSKLKISTQRDMSLQLNMPNREPDNTRGSFYVPVGEWVYFEELFTRESSENADDAVYKLWASPIDEYTPEPLIHVEGFKLGKLFDMSIGGNWQHHNDVKGYVYFDNIKISKEHIGPVNRPIVEK